ncbi:MAG: acyl-CoA dehydrogenase family protein [Myxococcota bacterium]|nr:acyl-CoA dehydrogenase family protein [Myxococcota bacterium]
MRNPFETPEITTFRSALRRFVEEEIAPHAHAWDEAGDFPWSLHERAGELGLFGLGIDEEYGGLGFENAFMRAVAWEELGRGAPGGVAASLSARNIMTGPIQALACDAIKQEALPEIVSGRKGGALAITEPSGGSDVANMSTVARREGSHWIIDGTKTFITGGLKASYYVVGARTGGHGLKGISLFFVESNAPGFSRESVGPKMGWWSSDTATLHFDHCLVEESRLMGQEGEGFIAIMENFNFERLGLAASMLGMAKCCLEQSIAYAQQRETFGRPLIQHQAIRHKIADMSSKLDAMESYIYQICWLIEAGEKTVADIAKLKLFCSRELEYVANEAMQILGGAAYLRGNPVERIYRETKVMSIGGGSQEIMRDLAVRQMGL